MRLIKERISSFCCRKDNGPLHYQSGKVADRFCSCAGCSAPNAVVARRHRSRASNVAFRRTPHLDDGVAKEFALLRIQSSIKFESRPFSLMLGHTDVSLHDFSTTKISNKTSIVDFSITAGQNAISLALVLSVNLVVKLIFTSSNIGR
jgi:hypothetical protein